MPECPRCGAGCVVVVGSMTRCSVCSAAPLVCRGVSCLDPFRCNTAGACSMPEPQPWDWAAMEPGDRLTVPLHQAGRARARLQTFKDRINYSRTFLTRTLPEGLVVIRIT